MGKKEKISPKLVEEFKEHLSYYQDCKIRHSENSGRKAKRQALKLTFLMSQVAEMMIAQERFDPKGIKMAVEKVIGKENVSKETLINLDRIMRVTSYSAKMPGNENPWPKF